MAVSLDLFTAWNGTLAVSFAASGMSIITSAVMGMFPGFPAAKYGTLFVRDTFV